MISFNLAKSSRVCSVRGGGAEGFKGIIWFLEVVEGGQLSSMEYKWGLQKIGCQLTANGGGGEGGWVIRMLQSFKRGIR